MIFNNENYRDWLIIIESLLDELLRKVDLSYLYNIGVQLRQVIYQANLTSLQRFYLPILYR